MTECISAFLSDIMAYVRPVVDLIGIKYLTLKIAGKPCCLRLYTLLGVLKLVKVVPPGILRVVTYKFRYE